MNDDIDDLAVEEVADSGDPDESQVSRWRAWRERRAARRAERRAAKAEAAERAAAEEELLAASDADSEVPLPVPPEDDIVWEEIPDYRLDEVVPETEDAEDQAVELDAGDVTAEESEAVATAPAVRGLRRQRPGRRQTRQALQRKRRRHRRTALLSVAVVVGIAAVAGVAWLVVRAATGPGTEDDIAAPAVDAPPPQTLLLIRRSDDDGPAHDITLLSGAAPGQSSAIVFLPVGTLVDIPGIGPDRLGFAQQYGGTQFVEATVENALGINIDYAATVTTGGLTGLLARTGGFMVNVPSRLIERHPDGSATVAFEAGPQFLDGPRLAHYWTFAGDGEDEITRIARKQHVLDGLFAHAQQDPAVLDRMLESGVEPLETAADATWVRELFGRLAAARTEDALKLQLLPVEPFGGPDETGIRAFRMQREHVNRMVAEFLAGSLPADGVTRGVRVQILNGVGELAVGGPVAARLQGGGYRIILTDNADRFDYEQTRIVIYEETREMLAVARDVQARLGVGRIEVSRLPVSIVDLTIVVGHDFPLPEAELEP